MTVLTLIDIGIFDVEIDLVNHAIRLSANIIAM